MKKTQSLIILAVIVLVVGVVGYSYLSQQSANQAQDLEKTSMIVNGDSARDSLMVDAESKMMAKSQYQAFNPEVLEATADTKRVLFFYASWCPTCRPADAAFSTNETEIPDGVSVIRVNYNDSETDEAERELAQKYGVTYQHTFVQIDAAGNQMAKWNGGSLAELQANIQ